MANKYKTNPLNGEHELNKNGLTLSQGQRFSMGLSVFNDLINIAPILASGYVTKQSYDFQALQQQINAEQMRLDAHDIIQAGYEAESKARVEGAKARGEQVAVMSANGFDVSSESYQNILRETDRTTEMNAAAIRRQYAGQASSYEVEAAMSDIQANMYKKAGKIEKQRAIGSAVMSGLTGAAKVAALRYFNDEEK